MGTPRQTAARRLEEVTAESRSQRLAEADTLLNKAEDALRYNEVARAKQCVLEARALVRALAQERPEVKP